MKDHITDQIQLTTHLSALEKQLQVSFHNRDLLLRAITHHSACPEDPLHYSYDTLEFLGDAIISAHVVEYIYHLYPDATEGEMTILKSEVVSRRVFALIGQQLGLFPFIRLDISSLRTFNERSRDSLCADVLEAIVGAIHLDQGSDTARDFIHLWIIPQLQQIQLQAIDTNPKGRLQKILLQQSTIMPRYRVLEQSGRQNDRVFSVGVFRESVLLGVGHASSIKEAGRLAAIQALQKLQIEHGS